MAGSAPSGIQPQQPMSGLSQSLGRVGQGVGSLGQGLQNAASGGKGGGTQQQVQPQVTQPQAPNIFQSAASGINDAMAGAREGMAYQPMSVNYTPYSAAQAGSQGYGAAQAGSQGYNAAQTNVNPNLQAQNVQAGQIGSTNLDQYMNPYTSQVIDTTMADIERQRQMAANQTAAQATAAGAFGGSREGVMQAETNKNYAQQAAQMAAQLRQADFMNAQQMAGQDIATRMQAGLANQQAGLQAGTTNAQMAMQQALANQSALNQAGQFGALAANQAALANQAAMNQAGQFGASAANQAALANQAAMNQAGQYNAGQSLQAQLANQNAGLSGAAQRLSATGQLGNLANIGFGMGQQTQAGMTQAGNQLQATQQALIDAANAQYGQYMGYPATSLPFLAQALGAAPSQATQTNSRKLGLFDYLTLGATAFGGK